MVGCARQSFMSNSIFSSIKAKQKKRTRGRTQNPATKQNVKEGVYINQSQKYKQWWQIYTNISIKGFPMSKKFSYTIVIYTLYDQILKEFLSP